MRLVVLLIGLLVAGAVGGFVFWPGLVAALEGFVVLVSMDVFHAGAASEFFTPLVGYVAMAAATFSVFFVAVRKLTGDR